MLLVVVVCFACIICCMTIGFFWYESQFETTTIGAPVYIQIGAGTELYPLTKRNCRQVTACGVRTRTKYCTCCETNQTGGLFKMLGNPCCQPNNDLRSIDGTAPVAAAAVTNKSK